MRVCWAGGATNRARHRPSSCSTSKWGQVGRRWSPAPSRAHAGQPGGLAERGESVRMEGRPHECRPSAHNKLAEPHCGKGWLRNGNLPGDLRQVRHCGAQNRRGLPCRCPAMRNGRCRLHGGLSTGPRTANGRESIRRARTVHGFYSEAARSERRRARENSKALRGMLALLLDRSDV